MITKKSSSSLNPSNQGSDNGMENNLPQSWIETTLGVIADWGSGGTPTSTESKYYNGNIPWLIIGDLNDGYINTSQKKITELALENSSAKIVPIGSVLIAMYGSIGKLGITQIECTTNQAIAFTQKLYGNISNKFLFYYLYSQKQNLLDTGKGGTQANISQTVLKAYNIPLPPLPEQTRIVAKLDAILARVNNCKTRLDKIPKLLKNFRQSVLAAAVSGELTMEWREEKKTVSKIYATNNRLDDFNWKEFIFPDEWKWDYTKNIGSHILGKMLDASKNKGEPTFYLRNISVRWFDFDLGNLSLIKATQEDKIKFDIRDGDVLICEGGEPGRAAVWNKGSNDFIFQKALHRIRFNKAIDPKWFLYNLKVDADNGNLEALFTGSGIKHLTLQSLSKYPIPIPSINEQKEIVRKVEELFHFADSIEARYQKAKAWFDKIPQAILAKAFRGELAPQNENDEPASVLLKRIQQEKNTLRQAQDGKKQKSSAKQRRMYEENDDISLVAEK